MRRSLKSYKTEINPNDEQKQKINKTIGTSRYVYNLYLAHNKEVYATEKRFISGMDFSKWLNNELIPNDPSLSWIKEVSSKSVKKSIMNAETAFKSFFKHKSGFPKFKKKGKRDAKMYFVKTDAKAVIRCERHRIKIPTLGWVRLKEKGYIPTTKSGLVIKGGSVSVRAGRYYVSVLVEEPDCAIPKATGKGIGIDLGLKSLAITSSGEVYNNINKTAKLKKLEKKLKREQRSLSRKFENAKKQKRGGSYSNLKKQKAKVQRLHQRIDNIRTDHINKAVSEIVKTKPSYITVEDLNVKGMMKNRHLSKAVASQKFYEFRTKLKYKCDTNGIELRVVDRWYPSSKTCNCCGFVKRDLKLSDRLFRCPECGTVTDRDYNAALNLRDAKIYSIA